jgi:hypothetical protein
MLNPAGMYETMDFAFSVFEGPIQLDGTKDLMQAPTRDKFKIQIATLNADSDTG